METYRLAYVTSSETLNRRAENLKWVTLISGFVTGLCSIPLFLNIPVTAYIIEILGTLTGLLTLSNLRNLVRPVESIIISASGWMVMNESSTRLTM